MEKCSFPLDYILNLNLKLQFVISYVSQQAFRQLAELPLHSCVPTHIYCIPYDGFLFCFVLFLKLEIDKMDTVLLLLR